MSRSDKLHEWLRQHLGTNDFTVKPASSDASFRQYFRVTHNGDTHIVMDAPPDKENSEPFVHVEELLLAAGLNVPRILDKDMEQGFLLLSDLGDRQYLQELNDDSVDDLYADAFSALALLQKNVDTASSGLPPYDEALLLQEMELFRDWFVKKHLSLTLSAGQERMIDDTYAFLAASALSQPVVCVHRDYHSRNLMVTKHHNPGVLDFQDAVIGPLTYDLVSLLRDCYIAWPRNKVEAWVSGYFQQYFSENSRYTFDEKQFLSWFDLMGIQRHLKAIGIFSRLNIRDTKPGYLKDIPRTLDYVMQVGPDFPELEQFIQFVSEMVVPGMRQVSMAGDTV